MRKGSIVAMCAAAALSVSIVAQQKAAEPQTSKPSPVMVQKPPAKVPTEAEYSQLMKDIQAAQQNMRKSVDAKTPADAAADAEKLNASFMQVEAFWKDRNVEDAIKAAGDALANSAKAAVAAKAANADDLQAAFTAMGGACRTCHTAHRERNADGTYKIK